MKKILIQFDSTPMKEAYPDSAMDIVKFEMHHRLVALLENDFADEVKEIRPGVFELELFVLTREDAKTVSNERKRMLLATTLYESLTKLKNDDRET